MVLFLSVTSASEQMNTDISLGACYPIVVSDQAKEYMAESFGLQHKSFFGNLFEIRVLTPERFLLTVGCRNSILPFTNVDTIGQDMQLYGNFLAPYIKLRARFLWKQ